MEDTRSLSEFLALVPTAYHVLDCRVKGRFRKACSKDISALGSIPQGDSLTNEEANNNQSFEALSRGEHHRQRAPEDFHEWNLRQRWVQIDGTQVNCLPISMGGRG